MARSKLSAPTLFAVALSLAACAGEPPPVTPPADVPAAQPLVAEPKASAMAVATGATTATTAKPSTTASPAASVAASSAPSASPQAAPTSGLRATTAMKMEGSVDADKLVASINTQVAALQSCVAAIRATDNVVGSLNLQVTIAKDGKVVTDLQSPVNDAGKRCLLDGARAWVVKGAGSGKAMLLLSL